jgi:hypothetical protein
MTISSVTLSPASSTSANILTGGDGQKYGMSLTADAYTTYVLPTGTA